MDPDATIKVMRDENADYDDRLDAAQALGDWLGIRGYPPRGMTRRATEAEIAAFFTGAPAEAQRVEVDDSRVDTASINDLAHKAAIELVTVGHASVVLEPGDMTAYRIMVGSHAYRLASETAYQSREYWVASQFGKLTEWSGDNYLTADYAAAKYADGHFHTGRVIAAFLNALAGSLSKIRTEVLASP